MSMTNYLEDALLNHVLRNVPYTPPAVVYLAFMTVPMTEAGDDGTEFVGGGYVRQGVLFTAGIDGASHNDEVLEYEQLPEGTIAGIGIADAETGGQFLFYEDVNPPKQVGAGDSMSVIADTITVTFD